MWNEKRTKIADHVMVFLVRGIKRKWKQPVSFYFTDGGMKAADLAVTLKTNITRLQGIGLTVVDTVSIKYVVSCIDPTLHSFVFLGSGSPII